MVDSNENQSQRPEKSVTELSVELTIAWLKRVESTADGRDPKEVVQAMEQFFDAIQHNRQRDAQRQPARTPAGAAA